MTSRICPSLGILALTLLSAGVARADDCVPEQQLDEDCPWRTEPRWEVGVAGFTSVGPDYPASADTHTNSLVLPFGIYRGDRIRAGDQGLIRAIALQDSNWELDLTLDGAFAADADDNDAREGMDDLDFLFGIGPEIKWYLIRDREAPHFQELTMEFQARAVFSTDFSSINQRGYAFETQLRYEREGLFNQDLKMVSAIGPIWGTEKLHNYFYQVKEPDITPERPGFDAKAGYLGTEVSLGLIYRFSQRRGRLFLGGQADFHHGAKNRNSPLFNDKTNYSFAIGFSWILLQSDERVVD